MEFASNLARVERVRKPSQHPDRREFRRRSRRVVVVTAAAAAAGGKSTELCFPSSANLNNAGLISKQRSSLPARSSNVTKMAETAGEEVKRQAVSRFKYRHILTKYRHGDDDDVED